MNTDTRPTEKVQHSFEGYGRFVLEYYGKEAYLHWINKISRLYPNGRKSCINPFEIKVK